MARDDLDFDPRLTADYSGICRGGHRPRALDKHRFPASKTYTFV
jgi:hypothetical protein